MWRNREVKRAGRGNLRRNYWAMVIVTFIMVLIVSEYGITSSIFGTGTGAENASNSVVAGHETTSAQIVNDFTQSVTNYQGPIDPSLNGTQGAFATVLNGVSRSMGVAKYIAQAVNSMAQHDNTFAIVLAFLLIAAHMALYIFIKNPLIVGERRFFLENKNYHKTRGVRILYLFIHRKVGNTVKVMFLKTFFNILWAFTIVGGVYKFYEYRMIRYILAENPDTDWRTCFSLSKTMMNGNKWRMFRFDLSFFPWYVLSSLTFGMLDIFYVNPYYTASETEIYFTLREHAIATEAAGYEYLNDDQLVTVPADSTTGMYPTITVKEHKLNLNSWKSYYCIENILLLFFTFMIIGWVWEEIYTFMQHGIIVKRGSLHGPWLPIYGIGGAMIVVFFRKLAEKPHLMFLCAFVSCGIMEYSTGWYFDHCMGVKYWDYSNYFMNLNGYVCLEGLLTFAFLACAGFYFIAPQLDTLYNKIPLKTRRIILIVLIPIFGADAVYSHFYPNTGEGVGGADYKQ